MAKALWYARWHLARWLVHGGLVIAPKGPARDLLVGYLNAYGREVMETIHPPLSSRR